MKFSCEKALLQQAIAIASRTVVQKSSIPALEGILVEADKDLFLTGYNLETGSKTQVPAEILQSGRLVLSARLFGEIIRRLPDDIVVFTSDQFMVNIKCGISEFNILGIDAEEFPALPTVDSLNSITLQQRQLKSMIAQTSFAIGTDESRPIHTGALTEVEKDGSITMVSVDGFRLAIRREQAENPGEREFSFVTPGSALNEVERICSDTDEPVEIIQGARHVMFCIGDTTLISRRLEGEFLNYRNSLPKNNPIRVTADRRTLMASVDRVSLIISEKNKSPLRCIFGDNILQLKSSTAIGNAYDECLINGDGKNLEIGFNNRYMMDALKAAPADELLLELNTPISPCLITPADGSNTFLYMLLPVRLKANG